MFNISSLGLLFDIYGAFWLTKSIILRSQKDIRKETSACWGWNSFAIQTQFKTKFEGWIGFSFLTLGFIFQFLNQFFPDVRLSWFEIFITVLVLIVGAFGIDAFGRAAITQQSEALVEEIKKEIDQKKKT